MKKLWLIAGVAAFATSAMADMQWISPAGPFGGALTSISTSPMGQKNIIVGGSGAGMFRSDTAGADWARATDDLPALIVGRRTISRVPGTATLYHAGFRIGNSPDSIQIFRSTDDGINWTRQSVMAGNFNGVHMDRSPVSGAIYLAVNRIGGANIHKSTDEGVTFVQGAADTGFTNGFAVAVDQSNTDVICAGHQSLDRIGCSRDGGNTFTRIPIAGSFFIVRDAVRDPSNNGIVYLLTDNGFLVKGDFRTSTETTNPMGTWSAASLDSAVQFTAVAVDPFNANHVLVSGTVRATAEGAIYSSVNGGASFVRINTLPRGAGIMEFDLNQQNRVFVSSSHLMVSENGGVTLTNSNRGLRESISRMDVNAQDHNSLFAGSSLGVYRTKDGGFSFGANAASNDGRAVLLPPGVLGGILVDPANPLDVMVSYQSGTGAIGGMRRSIDGGDSWTSVNPTEGPGLGQSFAFELDPFMPQYVYASWSKTGRWYRGLKSPSGIAWTDLGPIPGNSTSRLMVSPLVAGAEGRAEIFFMTKDPGTIIRSTDGGASFSPVHSISGTLQIPVYGASNPSILYAYSLGGDLYRSVDNGSAGSWQLIYTSATAFNNIVVDPTDSNIIYATVGATVTKFEFDSAGGLVSSGEINVGLVSAPAVLKFSAADSNGQHTLFAGTSSGLFKLIDTSSVPLNTSVGTPSISTGGTPSTAGAISMSFNDVQSGGNSSITQVSQSDAEYVAVASAAGKSNLTILDGSVYDLSTNAIYRGGFQVCITIAKPNKAKCNQLEKYSVYHVVKDSSGDDVAVKLETSDIVYYDGANPVTCSNQNANDIDTVRYCGTSFSASPFFVGTTNIAPQANAGQNQVIACTNPAGTPVTLDGSASGDFNEDALNFEWTGPFGTATGANVTVPFPIGTSSASLLVSDEEFSDESSTEVQVTVGVSGLEAPAADMVLVPTDQQTVPGSAQKFGRTIPLKLTLSCGATNLGPSHVGAPKLLDGATKARSKLGNLFKWSGNKWQYNLDTNAFGGPGQYDVRILMPDDTTWHFGLNLN